MNIETELMNKIIRQFVFASALLLATGAVSLFAPTTAHAQEPDTTPPTAAFGPIPEGATGVSQTTKLIFSEAVEGLQVSAFSGTVGATVTDVADDGDHTTYTITYTPNLETFTLTLAADSVLDTAATPNRGPAAKVLAHGNAVISEGPPTADAGDDLVVFVGAAVRLDGSASSDPNQESNTLTYVWEHTLTNDVAPATPYVLSNPAARRSPFTPTEEGSFTFTLTVTDNTGRSDTDTTTVSATSSDDTIRPVVTLGTIDVGVVDIEQEHTITFNEPVTGLNKGDFGGSIGLTVNKVTPGTGPSDTYVIAFTPTATTFTLFLTNASVQDASGNRGPLIVEFSDGTAGPAAIVDLSSAHTGGVERGSSSTLLNAGDTFTVMAVALHRALAPASLIGTAQFELQFSPNPPPQNLVATGNTNEYEATYTVRPGDLGKVTFRLRDVTDVGGSVREETADAYDPGLFADNTPPEVTLGSPRVVVAVGGTYTDAGVTTTDNGDTIETVITDPNDATVDALDSDVGGLYVYTYTVTDAAGNEITVFRTVFVGATAPDNRNPVASAGAAQSILPGAPVTLDGSASTDPDVSDTLSYAWVHSLTNGAAPTTPITLTDADTATASFTVPADAEEGDDYTLTLTVTDDNGGEASATVTITVPAVGISDLDGKSGVSIKDAKFLYYAHALDLAPEDSPALATVLGPLTSAGEGELGDLLTAAREELLVDLNDDGDIDAEDAAVLYYSFALEASLGNGGSEPGLPDIKRAILGPLAGTNDMDAINAMLRRVYAQRGL